MKALAILPDWLMLIMQGDKTIECRTWKTNYRGELLLCSSAKRIPGTIPGHALLICRLADVVPFTRKHLDAAALDKMPEGAAYAWMLEDIRYIKPFPVVGKLGLYEVDATPEILPPNTPEDTADKFFEDFILPLIYKPAQR